MKKILGLILLLIISLPLAAKADDDRWVLIPQSASSKTSRVFFDKQSVTKGSQDAIYRILVKYQYNTTSEKDHSHTLAQHEIDTDKRMYRILSVIYYDANNDVLHANNDVSQWMTPIPDTIEEHIYNAVTAYITNSPAPPKPSNCRR